MGRGARRGGDGAVLRGTASAGGHPGVGRPLDRPERTSAYTLLIEEAGGLDGQGRPRVRVRARFDELANLFGPVAWLEVAGGRPLPLAAALAEVAHLIAADARRRASQDA